MTNRPLRGVATDNNYTEFFLLIESNYDTCLNSAMSRSCLLVCSFMAGLGLFTKLFESLFFNIPFVAVPTPSKSISIAEKNYAYVTFSVSFQGEYNFSLIGNILIV